MNRKPIYHFIKEHYNYLIFFYPALYSLVFNYLNNIEWYLFNFFEDISNIIILLIISFFIKNRIILRVYFTVVLITLSIISYIEVSYFFLYNNIISISVIFILLETNTHEVLEYISFYFDKLVYITLFIFIPIIFIIIYIKKTDFKIKVSPKFTTILTAILFIAILAFVMKQERLIRYNLPYTAVKSYIGYVKEMKKYDNSFIEKKGGAFSEVKHKSINEETYVLIIGESFSKFHSSLYGYYRKTNVLLEKIHNELFIYNDVISPHANTLKSIPKILTLGNYENPDFIFKGSIIQLFNKAGFETYWLSNHEPIGINETGITKITKAADKHFFTNIEMPLAPLDEVLLDYLTEILSIDKKKKFIVIHLLGSHIYYADRYPENFNKFKDTPKTSFHNEKAYKEINEYDNSILYNDFIVWQIINYVKKTKTQSFIVYLSDHGEDVYKTSNMAYHEEGWKSKFVYQIPFIVWCSDTLLKQRKNLVFDTTRVYMTDDLIYSIADLADINFAQFDPERSIFNKKFKSRKRIILDSIDFDKKELIEKPNL